MTASTLSEKGSATFEIVRSSSSVTVVAALLFTCGLSNIWHVIFRGAAVPFASAQATRPLLLLSGTALVVFAVNLLQKRLAAFCLSLLALVVSTAIHVSQHGLDIAAILYIVALVALATQYKQFRVRSSRTSILQGLSVVGILALITFVYGVLGFDYLDPRVFNIDFLFVDSVQRAFREFFFLGNPDLPHGSAEGRWFLASLRWLGGISFIVMLLSLFQPLRYQLQVDPRQRAAATDITKNHSASSLDFFKLMPDKSLFFSQSGKSYIAYTTQLDTALALGDPVGSPEDREAVIGEYVRFCWRNGWLPAFFRAEPPVVAQYEQQELQLLKIGEEAIVDLKKFVTQTGVSKYFRRRRRKFEEDGYSCVRVLPPHDEQLIDQIEAVSNQWLSLPGRREQKFTLGAFSREYMSASPLFYLQDKDRQIIAFVNEVPSYAPGEATIDLMRHNTQIPNGAMDYLFMQLFVNLHERGYVRFNLGLAPLFGVGEELGASLAEQVVHQLYENMNHVFSYKGLRQYKEKFDPIWQDRFLVYHGGVSALLHTAAAVIKATR